MLTNKLYRVILEGGASMVVVTNTVEMAISRACSKFQSGANGYEPISHPVILSAGRIFVCDEEESDVINLIADQVTRK